MRTSDRAWTTDPGRAILAAGPSVVVACPWCDEPVASDLPLPGALHCRACSMAVDLADDRVRAPEVRRPAA